MGLKIYFLKMIDFEVTGRKFLKIEVAGKIL